MDVVPRPPALKSPDRLVTLCLVLFAAAAYGAAFGAGFARLPASVAVVATVLATALWAATARPSRPGVTVAAVAVPALLVLVVSLAAHAVALPAVLAALGCGVLTALLWRSTLAELHMTSLEGALDRLERVGGRAALWTGVAGLAAVLVRSWAANLVGVVALASSAVTLLVLLRRDRRRRAFLRDVYAGTAADLVVVPEAEIRGFAALPPLLSGAMTDAVLAHKATGVDSYRAAAGLRPLARCQHTMRDALALLERRGSRMVMSLGVLLGAFPAVVVVHLRAPEPMAIAVAAGPSVVAPSCTEARAYFSEALPAAVPGVGRMALLTHAQDETIAVGEGLLLVLPEGEGSAPRSMLDAALDAARRVPCRDKLVLRVGEPDLHPVDVEAWITVDGIADRGAVEREADDVVRELFQRDARAVKTEHVDFGSEDKSVGYRIRYALQHVPGSRHVKLHVNGHDGEEQLSPREYPTLRSLLIHLD
jgi:hypothetical protein